MTEFVESGSYVLPSEVSKDIASRLKEKNPVKGIEIHLRGESLEGAREFSNILLMLKKRGVKISHDLTIKLDFPKSISRDIILELLEKMPRSKNGLLKAKIHFTNIKKTR